MSKQKDILKILDGILEKKPNLSPLNKTTQTPAASSSSAPISSAALPHTLSRPPSTPERTTGSTLRSDSNEITPLHRAVRSGDLATLQQLLKTIVNIDVVDNEGKSPLHKACEGNKAEIIAELIRAGADVNLKDNNERTPLHIACYHRNSSSIVKVLLQSGVILNAKDKNGRTALQIATACENSEVIALLKEKENEFETF